MGYFAGTSVTNVIARGDYRAPKYFAHVGFWRRAREQTHESSRTDKVSGCSSLGLNLLLKRQKLCCCCQSCVSQLELCEITAVRTDH